MLSILLGLQREDSLQPGEWDSKTGVSQGMIRGPTKSRPLVPPLGAWPGNFRDQSLKPRLHSWLACPDPLSPHLNFCSFGRSVAPSPLPRCSSACPLPFDQSPDALPHF